MHAMSTISISLVTREKYVVYFDPELSKLLETRSGYPNVILGSVYVDTPVSLQVNMKFQLDAIFECYNHLVTLKNSISLNHIDL